MKQNVLTLFAKLLSSENISVVYARGATPSFNTKTRVLTLPMMSFDKNQDDLYDMFVSHEVAHALYTEYEVIHQYRDKLNHFFRYFNVVEDARIERLMKKKFAGAKVVFNRGYSCLLNMVNQDPNKSFIERINEWFSFGVNANAKFTDIEQGYVDRVAKTETTEDAILLAEEIFKLSGEPSENYHESSDSESETEPTSFYDKKEKLFDDAKSDGVSSDNVISECTPNELSSDVAYYTWTETHQSLFNANNKPRKVDDVKNLNSIISYALNEFEMKKSAKRYAKTVQSKTGQLNTKKLASYQLTDDIFKSVGVVPDDKSHGIYFMVDWSGSMERMIKKTLLEVIILVYFCRRVKIPFIVATFTDGSVREVLSSEMQTSVFNYMSECLLSGMCNKLFPMCHTPTTVSLAAAHAPFGDFISKYKIEKPIFICLTDGVEDAGDGNHRSLVSEKSGHRFGGDSGTCQFDVIELIKQDYNAKCIGYSIGKIIDSEKMSYISPDEIAESTITKVVGKFGYFFHKPSYSYDIVFGIVPSNDPKKRKTILKHLINEVA